MLLKSFLCLSACVTLVAFGFDANGADPVKYSTQVAPVLRAYCLSCHSRVEAQNGLSLQAPDDILKGGENGAVLDAATPNNSRLLQVLTSTGDDHMPPVDEPQPNAEELSLLKQWLIDGAAFDSRMAVLPALPQVAVTSGTVRSPVLAMGVSRDGKSLLMGKFKSVEQRSIENRELVWAMVVPDGKVNGLHVSSDGESILLATGTPGLSGRAIEVGIGSTEIRREFAGHNDILYAATWSPDGALVATAGYDRRIILHDAKTGKQIRELLGHNGAIFDLQFSPDGTLLASASADATVKIWHVASGERFDTLSQPQSEQYAVTISPDGRFIFAAGADSRIRKWKLVSVSAPQINPLMISRFAHEGAITKMEMSADGRFLATASENGSIKLWDTKTVSEQFAETLDADFVSSLAFEDVSARLVIATAKGGQQTIALPSIAPPETTVLEASVVMVSDATDLPVDVAEVEIHSTDVQVVSFPAAIAGVIDGGESSNPDIDAFRFDARKGQAVLVEVNAAREKSPLDSNVEIVDSLGKPVLQAQLQAVRDSYFTFRGKDSDTSDDFRVFNWQEMELNEYLYADGEVVKLWLYPRGPDSGFKVYPGFGSRQTYFETTPTSHPLQGPAFIVVPHAPDAALKDTGLPVFPIFAQNDDDPMRQWGQDSRLMFYPPADGSYVVRIKDARGFQGAGYKYKLLLRHPRPDFSVAMSGAELSIHRGTGREISFTATRLDGYAGPIEIFAENLPPGFSLSDPVLIQDEQRQAFATLIASADAVQPADDAVAKIVLKARARISEMEVTHDIGGLKSLKLAEKPKVLVRVMSAEQQAAGVAEHTPELTVWTGETVKAFLKVERLDHAGLVEFGKEDSGRNMPHGVFVDNIGLNGLMLLEGQNEREFFITTAKGVPEMSRPFYLKSNVDGGITTFPVMLHIRHRSAEGHAIVPDAIETVRADSFVMETCIHYPTESTTECRIMKDETGPNSDKLFSMFEPHTQLYKRGKAGEPVQFGRQVLVYKADHEVRRVSDNATERTD